MAVTSNKLIPIIATVGIIIVGVVIFKQFSGDGSVKAGADLKTVPALPETAGADRDTPAETLRTVATSNADLREQVGEVIKRNNDLIAENKKLNDRLNGGAAGAATGAAQAAGAQVSSAPPPAPPAERSTLEKAIDTAAGAADTFTRGLPSVTSLPKAVVKAPTFGDATNDGSGDSAPGAVQYSVVTPMGWAVQTDKARGASGQAGVTTTHYVRTSMPQGSALSPNALGPATQAAQAAAQNKFEDIPYFTIPENGTLAGATAMTALIGRVPIDGRVTDPMQFKAVVGRDNLAANGFELPPDIAGMIVTGIAIGDMALSCSEGKVRSITFVFNDGAIRTVSARSRAGGAVRVGSAAGSNDDLGFISDLHGNPCIAGTFVTNAPAYLTDMIALGALGVAGQAYSEAQRTTYSGMAGSSSQITGSAGSYALGQAVAGGTSEVSKWMMQRLKNSFDAVITPSGQQFVVHLDREIRIDKARAPRKLIHRQQGGLQLARGEHHGLE